MTQQNQFLTSVANVRLFDRLTDELILNGKTLLNSSMTQAIQTQAIHAGKGSKKVYELNYQKELTFSIEDAAFDTAYIALQNGTEINHQLAEFFTDEIILLDADGKGTLADTPVGKVHVEQLNGTFTQYAPAGKDISVPALAGKEVQVVYAVQEMMDTIEISADSFPKAVRMELNVDIRSNNGKTGEVIIEVPNFKPNGAVEISMTHEGVASSSLAGSSLADKKGNYAYIKLRNLSEEKVQFTALAANPSRLVLDSAVAGDSQRITVLGIRGAGYSNVLLQNNELTWKSKNTSIATVDANGVVTLGAAAKANDQTTIEVTDGTFSETIAVDVI
ncbi:Ig-like domain-containing protein [Lysinibacillus sp. NPDC095746]|uniref:Ig-like domain-containing protein n=1 Tax=unclassified Lysinibacillus TaxID=2636778 RepID=UPI0023648767|nr:Ig-like domain-containing protein [Lysinibacillus sp. CNPSo 3705]MDD1502579.1 Ig-like domain-containing protein [Lysinibacillus sp. CNPSo 3705]